MVKKCVHKGCGKTYEDDDDECVYHPGPPEFHEGQKGWKCCKPRVLTFDEFLTIPPCTTGKHSQVDDTPAPAPAKAPDIPDNTPTSLGSLQEPLSAPQPRLPTAETPRASPSPAPPESEDDDPSLAIALGQPCRRRACGHKYGGDPGREGEQCVHHPGVPIFHEGSKGYSCCKRRVLEFDEFLRLRGCKTRDRHLFVGSGKSKGAEEKVDTIRYSSLQLRPGEASLTRYRHDFYQTGTTVVASLFLKKIDKDKSTVRFQPSSVILDLRTADSKRYQTELPLFATIDPSNCKFRILGTKLELTLAKADGASWPVFRSDDRLTGEMIQVGRAGTV